MVVGGHSEFHRVRRLLSAQKDCQIRRQHGQRIPTLSPFSARLSEPPRLKSRLYDLPCRVPDCCVPSLECNPTHIESGTGQHTHPRPCFLFHLDNLRSTERLCSCMPHASQQRTTPRLLSAHPHSDTCLIYQLQAANGAPMFFPVATATSPPPTSICPRGWGSFTVQPTHASFNRAPMGGRPIFNSPDSSAEA
ncbi:hypothetical protein DL93DRAFT_38691 [Clavulina sp. PMI_390]|nr:hypothetical protein DL93DRAFT_38691 [Clavulina sp. PMI_390]